MQSKLSVLQVIPNLNVSGAEQGCIDIANYLTANNYESYILTTLYLSGGSTIGPFEMEILDFNTMNLGWPTSFNTPINFKRATLEEINKLNLNIEGICKPQS